MLTFWHSHAPAPYPAVAYKNSNPELLWLLDGHNRLGPVLAAYAWGDGGWEPLGRRLTFPEEEFKRVFEPFYIFPQSEESFL